MQGKANITERAARWSATHRKTAIWGWLGIVFTLIALIMGAEVVEQKDISAVDSFSRRVTAGRARPHGRRPAARTRRW